MSNKIIRKIDKKITLNKKEISQKTYSEFKIILSAIQNQKDYLKLVFNSFENPNIQEPKPQTCPEAHKQFYIMSTLHSAYKYYEEIIDAIIIGRYSVAYTLLRNLFEQWSVLSIIVRYNKLSEITDYNISNLRSKKDKLVSDIFLERIMQEPIIMQLWDYSCMDISPEIKKEKFRRKDLDIEDDKYYKFLQKLFSPGNIKYILGKDNADVKKIINYHYKLMSVYSHGIEFSRYSNDYQYLKTENTVVLFYGGDFNNAHAHFLLYKSYNLIDLILYEIRGSQLIKLPDGYTIYDKSIFDSMEQYKYQNNITLDRFKLYNIFGDSFNIKK